MALAATGEEPVAFITRNLGDFGRDKDAPKLHPDLLADLDERGIPTERVELYRDLSAFNDARVTPRLQELAHKKESEELRDRLLSGEDERLRDPAIYDQLLAALNAEGVTLGTFISMHPAVPASWSPVVRAVRPAHDPPKVEVTAADVLPDNRLLVTAATVIAADFVLQQRTLTVNGGRATLLVLPDFIIDPASGEVTGTKLRAVEPLSVERPGATRPPGLRSPDEESDEYGADPAEDDYWRFVRMWEDDPGDRDNPNLRREAERFAEMMVDDLYRRRRKSPS